MFKGRFTGIIGIYGVIIEDMGLGVIELLRLMIYDGWVDVFLHFGCQC